MGTRVNEITDQNGWRVPVDCVVSCPGFGSVMSPRFHDCDDKLWWLLKTNTKIPFSVSHAWNSIREEKGGVSWYRIVWYSQCIPKHSFMVWLVMHQKLKTEDKLRSWDNIRNANNLLCFLCNGTIETHNHLFFECAFAMQVRRNLLVYANLSRVPCIWGDFISFLEQRANKNAIWGIIQRLLLGSIVYNIWKERNHCLFKKHRRSVQIVAKDIVEEIRFKLLSLRTKPSS